MSRKVNRTKRAKLNSHGFKVYKNFRLYIGEATEGGWHRGGKPAPRKEIVDMVRDMWNNDQSIKAMRKYIKQLSIVYQKTNKFVGIWFSLEQKVMMIDDRTQSLDWMKSTFIHEVIGHAFWDFAKKWRREELIAFNLLANSLPPVSTYIKNNEDDWRKTNDDNDERKKFEKKYEGVYDDDISYEEYNKDLEELKKVHQSNGHYTMTRYANEQHSAITEIVYGGNGHHPTLLSDDDVNQLVELWKKLHY